jgi:hypothetical protein
MILNPTSGHRRPTRRESNDRTRRHLRRPSQRLSELLVILERDEIQDFCALGPELGSALRRRQQAHCIYV